MLNGILAGEQYPDPSLLAHRWVAVYGIPAPHVQWAVAELTPIAAEFIAQVQTDYYKELS
jgi:hypothetical protein